MSSPTQRSLKKLRDEGCLAHVVEKYNAFVKRRFDAWGFDILFCRKGEIGLLQTTTASNMNARIEKIANLETTPMLRDAGFRLLVHGWVKKKGRWTVNVKDVS